MVSETVRTPQGLAVHVLDAKVLDAKFAGKKGEDDEQIEGRSMQSGDHNGHGQCGSTGTGEGKDR